MNDMFMWCFIIFLAIALYFNLGYAYIQYMNRYDSSHSLLRRFLAGGWDHCSKRLEQELDDGIGVFHYATWIVLLLLTMFLWILWLAWKVIYFTFGGFAREVLKEKEDDKN